MENNYNELNNNRAKTALETLSNDIENSITTATNNQYQPIENIKTILGNDNVSFVRTYQLKQKISGKDEIIITDRNIIQRTDTIQAAINTGKAMDFVICRELSKMNAPEYLKALNCKNISQYASAFFDLSPKTVIL